eukprot:scaffold9914_cov17-Tisochrysis_lutea.AAC.2
MKARKSNLTERCLEGAAELKAVPCKHTRSSFHGASFGASPKHAAHPRAQLPCSIHSEQHRMQIERHVKGWFLEQPPPGRRQPGSPADGEAHGAQSKEQRQRILRLLPLLKSEEHSHWVWAKGGEGAGAAEAADAAAYGCCCCCCFCSYCGQGSAVVVVVVGVAAAVRGGFLDGSPALMYNHLVSLQTCCCGACGRAALLARVLMQQLLLFLEQPLQVVFPPERALGNGRYGAETAQGDAEREVIAQVRPHPHSTRAAPGAAAADDDDVDDACRRGARLGCSDPAGTVGVGDDGGGDGGGGGGAAAAAAALSCFQAFPGCST